MPTYSYFCKKCNVEFDIVQKITEAPLTSHVTSDGNVCSGPIEKLIPKNISVVWKGGAPTPKTYI